MNVFIQRVIACGDKAEALRKERRWSEAAAAYDELAKAWIAATGAATSEKIRAERLEKAEKAREAAARCRDRAAKKRTTDDDTKDRRRTTPKNDKDDDWDDDDESDGSAADEGSNPSESEFLVADKPTETLDDIMGMADAKRAIEDFLQIIDDPEGAKKFNLRADSSILLYGPPGNGKTMFGKAIANRVNAPFYYASGANIRTKWVGESSQRLHQLFQLARKNPVSVVFFDEIETLIPRRGENTHDSDKQIVTQFLQEVGGFLGSDSKMLLLGATNCPWDIDDAAFRTGRFDLKIFIGAPDAEARLGMFKRAFKGVELDPSIDLEAWAKRLDLYSGSDIAGLAMQARKSAYRRYRADKSETSIRATDLEDALRSITRTITPELLRKYEDFAKSRA